MIFLIPRGKIFPEGVELSFLHTFLRNEGVHCVILQKIFQKILNMKKMHKKRHDSKENVCLQYLSLVQSTKI